MGDDGVPLRLVTDYPDYYAENVGSREYGRIVATPMLDARTLGAWQHLPRPRTPLTAGVVRASIHRAIPQPDGRRLQLGRAAPRD